MLISFVNQLIDCYHGWHLETYPLLKVFSLINCAYSNTRTAFCLVKTVQVKLKEFESTLGCSIRANMKILRKWVIILLEDIRFVFYSLLEHAGVHFDDLRFIGFFQRFNIMEIPLTVSRHCHRFVPRVYPFSKLLGFIEKSWVQGFHENLLSLGRTVSHWG